MRLKALYIIQEEFNPYVCVLSTSRRDQQRKGKNLVQHGTNIQRTL